MFLPAVVRRCSFQERGIAIRNKRTGTKRSAEKHHKSKRRATRKTSRFGSLASLSTSRSSAYDPRVHNSSGERHVAA